MAECTLRAASSTTASSSPPRSPSERRTSSVADLRQFWLSLKCAKSNGMKISSTAIAQTDVQADVAGASAEGIREPVRVMSTHVTVGRASTLPALFDVLRPSPVPTGSPTELSESTEPGEQRCTGYGFQLPQLLWSSPLTTSPREVPPDVSPTTADQVEGSGPPVLVASLHPPPASSTPPHRSPAKPQFEVTTIFLGRLIGAFCVSDKNITVLSPKSPRCSQSDATHCGGDPHRDGHTTQLLT